ncbi:DNA polymerase III subunit gamma/tau [Microbacteriaceae bacterium]|nr:DNA polymerase III subunit gamma/tau [Candidatus Saccharibacteria bacterium]
MGKALYRKYRSKSLDEVVGQTHITDILRRAIAADKIAHAYLLTGPRGVGKTSIARILAHEINGLEYTDESTHLDIIEIDAASNNSVEDIRDLREKVQIAPSSAKKKIYIIDEVHMLSKSAFNALLKTLEEPPEHVVFILATTNLEKLPATIVSRVQQFHFRPIGEQDAVEHLRSIAKKEHIAIDNDALHLIAQHGGGSFRDSISLLDQLSSISDDSITTPLIESLLGLADKDTVSALLAAYEAQNLETIVSLMRESETHGTPATQLASQLISAVQTSVTEKPHLLSLLDNLLDVQKSTWPGVKLLVALSKPSQSKHMAVASPAVVSAPVILPKQATKPSSKTPSTKEALPQKSPVEPVLSVEQDAPTTKKQTVATDNAEFPWQDFMVTLKEDTIGAATILSKCGHEYNGTTLIIYAGKPFAKKQLEKYLSAIQKSMQTVGVEDADITILAEPKPASDSQTAAVLAMMGGGEEVSL